MLDEDVLLKLLASARGVLAHTPSCMISADQFHKVSPDLPFGEEEVIQATRFYRQFGIAATGIRLDHDRVSMVTLVMARSSADLANCLASIDLVVDDADPRICISVIAEH